MAERIILTAAEGMVLTDGTHFGKVVYLAEGSDPSAYYQITKAEHMAIKEREQEQSEDCDELECLADDELEVEEHADNQ